MTLLAYGILRGDTQGLTPPPEGLDGKPVSFALAVGLAAPFSTVPESWTVPDVARALSYARVVESFHEHQAILPLRYGTFFDSAASLGELLCRRRGDFLTALDRVKGRTEMGIRVLLGETATLTSAPSSTRADHSLSAGADYLARRRRVFQARDACKEQQAQAIERIRTSLEGLYDAFASDVSPGRDGLLSLYFLVARNAVDGFVQGFRRLQETSTDKMYLTGPWPPYNFVCQPALIPRADPAAR